MKLLLQMKKSITLNLAVIISILLFTKNAYSQSSVIINDTKKKVDVCLNALIYEDKTNQLAFKDIISQSFTPTNSKVPNLGITNSTFWLKIPITNITSETHFLLNLDLPNLDFVELYDQDKNNKLRIIQMGEHLPFYMRNYEVPAYIFELIILQGQSKLVYLKLKCKEALQLPITIGADEVILNEQKDSGILLGIFVGIMLSMILYNLFIYFSSNDRSYLFYVLYIICVTLAQTSSHGFPFQYLWPNTPIIAQYSLFVFPAVAGITGIHFMNVFLNVKTRFEKLYFFSFIFYAPYLTSIILLFFEYYKISHTLIEINAALVSIYLLITPIIILKGGYTPAKYFLIAWSFFLIGVIIFILKDFEILPYNNFTRYTMIIGSALETILLSFALADRINILKKEKEKSQDLALTAMREKRKVIADQNKELEKTVAIRTQELQTSLTNLKDAQVQLVNAEKMASLGQLTAGIAHEINNPINFVTANIKPLKLDIVDLLELLNKYEALKPDEKSVNQFREIEEYRKDIDIEYIKKEIDDLLTGIENGAQRTADIVVGLKNFSRLDESEIKKANINEGILSTLLLIKRSVPDNTEVVTELGEIPFIECLPGKLNQVFMNLFSNALYAIAAKKDSGPNKLTIKTFELGDKICMSLEDTGIGMSEEVKNKIFEPFFTTKDVGEGTGLGMSIVFKILENHQAKLEVESKVGIGTKFLLTLNKNIIELKS